VSINTAAVVNPDIVTQTARRFGCCATVVNIDPKRVPVELFAEHRRAAGLPAEKVSLRMPTGGTEHTAAGSGAPTGPMVFEVHTHGGRKPTGLEAVAWARRVVQFGAGEIVLTSMDADGTKNGYDLEMTAAVAAAVGVPVVASGGCGSPEHIRQVLDPKVGADAALAASIFHYGQYGIRETKSYLAERGIAVRQSPLSVGEG
jgi:cyclase